MANKTIAQLSNLASPLTGDLFAIWDTTVGNTKNVSLAQLQSVLTPTNYLKTEFGEITSTLTPIEDQNGTNSALSISTNKIGLNKDTSVTTQSVAVVEVQDANTSIALKPNGTGGIIASVPDGTAVGGNARGTNAVDLQIVRDSNVKVAGSIYSVIAGGYNNGIDVNSGYSVITGGKANRIANGGYAFIGSGNSNFINGGFGFNHVIVGGTSNTVSGGNGNTFIGGGSTNTISGGYGVITGGLNNTVSSNYSTVSGGQSNTASTNTHATVVGGSSNTASGQLAVAGGWQNTASGSWATAFGRGNTCNAIGATAFGQDNVSEAQFSTCLGGSNRASSFSTVVLGYRGQSYLYAQNSLSSGYFTGLADAQQSILTARNSSALTTGATLVLSLDGTGTTNLIIPDSNNRAWNVQIDTIAVVTAITGTATGVSVGDCYRETKQLLFKRIGGTSSIVGTVDTSAIKLDSGMSTASITISAGGSQQMAITFTAPTFAGSGSITCRIVSKVMLVEVAY
jgi:hypothetical protein